VAAWGQPGLRDGNLKKPRAIGVHGDEVYVVDKTGRIQVFSLDGQFRRKWSTPAYENGTPTSVAFATDGNVLVPDTHYSWILKYTPDGQLLDQWGSYGTGPDQFIYPTDLAQDTDGAYYISEYGINAERIHVFDAEKRFLRQWGALGDAPGQLNRAMAIALGRDGLLYVADTANHRVQCFDTDGRLVRVIGEAGTAPGQLKFPYDVAIAPDASLLAAEYGNHRVSRFRTTGEFVGCLGGPGRALGQFNGPRGVTVSSDGMVFVADMDNDRIQQFPMEDIA
jgi:DNA-binding beta-propeller fold protein YncE